VRRLRYAVHFSVTGRLSDPVSIWTSLQSSLSDNGSSCHVASRGEVDARTLPWRRQHVLAEDQESRLLADDWPPGAVRAPSRSRIAKPARLDGAGSTSGDNALSLLHVDGASHSSASTLLDLAVAKGNHPSRDARGTSTRRGQTPARLPTGVVPHMSVNTPAREAAGARDEVSFRCASVLPKMLGRLQLGRSGAQPAWTPAGTGVKR
jgi:hypothetical protein